MDYNMMSELVELQKKHNKSARRYHFIMIVLTASILLIIGSFTYHFQQALNEVAKEVPNMMSAAVQVMEDIGNVIENLEQELTAIDIDNLNKSIENLGNITEGMSDFFSFFR